MRTAIVLALVALAANVGAVPVDPNAQNGIAAWDGVAVLCTSGEVFYWDDGVSAWTQPHDGRLDVPIPVEQIADWSYNTFVSVSGEHWHWSYAAGWYVIPLPDCAGAVQQEGDNLGDVKSIFR